MDNTLQIQQDNNFDDNVLWTVLIGFAAMMGMLTFGILIGMRL